MQGRLLQTELSSPENQNEKLSLQLFAYFSVLKIDLLRFVEQIQHLPQSKLKIHVSEMENPSKILKKKIYEINCFLVDLSKPCTVSRRQTCSWICRLLVLEEGTLFYWR